MYNILVWKDIDFSMKIMISMYIDFSMKMMIVLNYHFIDFKLIYLRRICVINKQNPWKKFYIEIPPGVAFGVATPG